MNKQSHSCEVLVIGGGPAGLAAANCAVQSGARVAIVDDNPQLGGQIWRGEENELKNAEAAQWLQRVRACGADFIAGARVFEQPAKGLLLAETFAGVLELRYQKLILALGARERFLPFPGWTLPNVMGAGGLQALAKSGLPIAGRKIVVAGTGPLLLAVAAYLRKCGANVLLIAEQTPQAGLLAFGFGLWRTPGKIVQALQLKRELIGIPHHTDCWPLAAAGADKLERVTLRRGAKTWEVECDYLACGFHLVPNVELAVLLGCALRDEVVQVDEFQATTVNQIYCAGEATGIGGLELSLVEGQIAGYAAAGQTKQARALFAARSKHQRFATALNRAFALRAELKQLPQADTIICRCEDVTWERVQSQANWRAVKLQTRCGMGPCQGRICGAALEFLQGWQPESVRPPIFPVKVGSLIRTAEISNQQ